MAVIDNTKLRKKIIILSPHFPPSNLVGVHRTRFLSKYLIDFDIEPIVVCVHEKFYEEQLDLRLLSLVPDHVRIEKVNAFKIGRFRLIGDIGLRAFFQLLFRILKLIRNEKIKFLYITIPSFYTSLIGRIVYILTKTPYGIDYQDPWVHVFKGSEKKFSRFWLATKLSSLLEPFAVKKASLITGVNEQYYKGVKDRNPHLLKSCKFLTLPIGIDQDDFDQVNNNAENIFSKSKKIKLIYAGAFLPKAHDVFVYFCKGLMDSRLKFNIELYFVGTGVSRNGSIISLIQPIAEDFNLWNTVIFEFPQRRSYLDTLSLLKQADGIFILGSVEPHYSPSKVYQAILAKKPILAILNKVSDAKFIIENAKAGIVLDFDGNNPKDIYSRVDAALEQSINFFALFDPSQINDAIIDDDLAKNISGKLAKFLKREIL